MGSSRTQGGDAVGDTGASATGGPLTARDKLSYGLGSTAEALVFTTTSSFTLLFYNQVRGLDAGLVGTALALGLLVNAFVDPMIGSWSDRTRNRWGRRHPFMYASAVPTAVLSWFLWHAPVWRSIRDT